ncbi:UDP-glycosyltransferase UGT5-like [Schistocerca serialis cubense]|uniref:UDP-glycosyltransferase UGT5-like n=1 Tax=Schistocerca serialis cubense TaxID=2023355 RepID=UPI00214E28BE|nr:UDP-glycosyltransferase UGT5-like [Schistocerca serialis cubense]
MRTTLLLTAACLLALGDRCLGARILAAVPTPSISHQLPLRTVLLELARRGHQVTFITTHPIHATIANYTEVDLSESYRNFIENFDLNELPDPTSPVAFFQLLLDGARYGCQFQFGLTPMKEFLKLEQKYDVFIIEKFGFTCYYGLAHKLGSPPLIGYTSLGPTSLIRKTFGSPINPSYIPDYNLGYTDHMTFWQRLYNAYILLRSLDIGQRVLYAREEEELRKYSGPNPPTLREIDHNFSLMLVNNHFSVSYPVPNTPNIVELTGLHIQKERKPLPKDVGHFLDGARNGVVYFSLGSNVRSTAMPPERVRAFLDAFAGIPQRVLWKWEADGLPGHPGNVMTAKWLPQQDVLAHPNVRLFITQGGLQSWNEAAYFSVPVIGIPFLGDQIYNVEKMVGLGVGRRLDLEDVTKDSVMEAIQTVLEDKSYQENMKRFSAIYREHQSTSLERAVWWVEYVIRHQGAPHLRSAALDLHWWQLLLLDVIGFILAVAAVVAFVLYRLTRLLFTWLTCRNKLKKQ